MPATKKHLAMVVRAGGQEIANTKAWRERGEDGRRRRLARADDCAALGLERKRIANIWMWVIEGRVNEEEERVGPV
jgi:hypothetical protein